jgi:N-acyl-D-aspartate/D-glutamate deacylase
MAAPADAEAARRLDVTGSTVVPGFIDPHTHATQDLLDPERKGNVNFLMQGVTTVLIGNDGGGLPDLDESLARMRSQGIGTNAAFYAGHNDIRRMVMGLENRLATEEELEAMREIVADQMEAGAVGLSTGLYYTPGSYAPTEEVIELAKVSARFGGIYDSHLRDESSYNIGLLGAIEELIRIGEEASIPVHIAHLKALGRDVWGQSGDIIARVEAARERGVEVTADQYPYRASGTSFASALIPAWVRADSTEAMFGRIENPDLAQGIREEMEANLWRRGGAESLLVTGDSEWRGRTLQEIAEATGADPLEAAVEVVRSGNPSIASFNMNPDDISAIAIQEWVMTGSDGSGGHPRKYATYPTAYRDMVVRDELFSLEWFVRRSSGLVADSLRLCDRGYLQEGKVADIVVLDLASYEPVADFQNPAELATGVVHSIVNGQFAIANRELLDALPGVVIDRQSISCP